MTTKTVAGIFTDASDVNKDDIRNNMSSVCPSIAELRGISGGVAPVLLLGYYSLGDAGGGGLYHYSSGQPAGTYVDNGGSIIVPTGGDGSAAWLMMNDDRATIKQFGAKGDGSTDDADAINEALGSGIKEILIPPADSYYKTASQITVPIGVEFRGIGMARDRAWGSIRPTSAVSVGIYVQHSGNTENGLGIKHLSLDMQDMPAGSIGIHVDGNWYNDLEDVDVTNVATAINKIGIQFESSGASLGTYINRLMAVRVDGNDATNTYTGCVGIKLLGSGSYRLTSTYLEQVSTNNIESGIVGDYLGSGIVGNYVYHSNVTYGFTSTNPTNDNVIIIGGEYNPIDTPGAYSFSGRVLVIGGAFNGTGSSVMLDPGTGARFVNRGIDSIGATQTVTATTDQLYPDYSTIKVAGTGGVSLGGTDPQITAGHPGQILIVQGTSDTNTVTLTEGNGLALNSQEVILTSRSMIALVYDSAYTHEWRELWRTETTGSREDSQSGGGTVAVRHYQGRLKEITVTDTTAFSIGAIPDGDDGDIITFKIYNNSGGSLGTITWNAIYKHDGTWSNPANTKYKLISFMKAADGNWYQVAGPTGDI